VTGDPIPSDDLDELTAAMADLTGALESEPSEEEILDAVCAEAVRAVPGADMASITAIRDGEPETAASTDERAVEIDRVQYAAGEGPCLRAAETGEIVRLPLGTAGALWPEFTQHALGLGVGSYLAAPLRVDGALAGALNLFGYGDHGFAETDSRILRLYTTIVSFGLRTTPLPPGPAARRRTRDGDELAGGDRAGQGHSHGRARDHRRGRHETPDRGVAAHQREAP
jgi:hypothetical protein